MRPYELHGGSPLGAARPEYRIWASMIQRCENPNNDVFHNYGGRGITVCARWRHSFASFLKDVGPRPDRKLTLERRNNNEGYNPTNCYWATRKQQASNTRVNKRVTCDGRTHTLTEWAELLGVSFELLRDRIARGWPIERVIKEPKHVEFARRRKIPK